MSTTINVTVDDGGLPARNKQQVAANRQAYVQSRSAEQSAEQAEVELRLNRLGRGLDPTTGRLSASAGASSRLQRIDQKPAANRNNVVVWDIDYTDLTPPLTYYTYEDIIDEPGAPSQFFKSIFYVGVFKKKSAAGPYLFTASLSSDESMPSTEYANRLQVKIFDNGLYLNYDDPQNLVQKLGGDARFVTQQFNLAVDPTTGNQDIIPGVVRRGPSSITMTTYMFIPVPVTPEPANPTLFTVPVSTRNVGLSAGFVADNEVFYEAGVSVERFSVDSPFVASNKVRCTLGVSGVESIVKTTEIEAPLSDWIRVELKISRSGVVSMAVDNTTVLTSSVSAYQGINVRDFSGSYTCILDAYEANISDNEPATELPMPENEPPYIIGPVKVVFS